VSDFDNWYFLRTIDVLGDLVAEFGPFDDLGVPTRWRAFAAEGYKSITGSDEWFGTDVDEDTSSRMIPAVSRLFASSKNFQAAEAYLCVTYGIVAGMRSLGRIERGEQRRIEELASMVVARDQQEIAKMFYGLAYGESEE